MADVMRNNSDAPSGLFAMVDGNTADRKPPTVTTLLN